MVTFTMVDLEVVLRVQDGVSLVLRADDVLRLIVVHPRADEEVALGENDPHFGLLVRRQPRPWLCLDEMTRPCRVVPDGFRQQPVDVGLYLGGGGCKIGSGRRVGIERERDEDHSKCQQETWHGSVIYNRNCALAARKVGEGDS